MYPLAFAAFTFTPCICVEIFITVPLLSSSQATTPPSPSASTSISFAVLGLISSVKTIFVTVSGIEALKSLWYVTKSLVPLISNVNSFAHKSKSPVNSICGTPSSEIIILFLHVVSLYHATPVPTASL